ncbi:MAG TPA: alanine racemase [Chloroflexia bacterium]|nr:alanine racemase [Chloroflexia bacterium]
MQSVRDNPAEAQEDMDAVSWGRPIRAEIDLSAVASNVRALRKLIGSRCRVMAVVKANGYGLGATWVAAAAIEGGASMLAVACVDEGVELRRAGYSGPILVMSYVPPDEAEAAVRNGLTLVLHRIRTAEALDEAARKQGLRQGQVAVHIKVDTGLGRYGCLPGEFLPLAQGIMRLEHLRLEGLMTHFAHADAEDLSFTREQLSRFNWVRRQAEEHGIQFDIIHAANTAAALALPESRFDMVRAGILLSGHLPAPHLQGTVRLESALTLRSRLVRVFRVEEGETIGYGRTWVAGRPSVVGLVPVGYADGYPRELSNRGEALVGGVRCPVAGRVSMDQIGLDLTDVPGVAEGDEVVLIGQQGKEEITADEIAGWCGTISYEILCGMSDRVPRHYIHDGQPIEVCNLLGCSPTRERTKPRRELSR